jgi:hypothetical protein
MSKESTKKAIDNYYIRQSANKTKAKRKNGSPEKLVEKEVLAWCKQQGWSVDVVESKAVYSASAGRYLSGQTKSGYADVVGSTDQGLSVSIELKSPGRLATVRLAQYEFLKEKIHKNCFAVVVDSAKLLESTYLEFLQSKNRIQLLMSRLPLPKELKKDSEQLFK